MPVLIIFFLAVSQIGVLIYIQNVLEQSSREGARIISTTNSNSKAYKSVYKLCGNLERENLKVAIKPESKSTRGVGDMVSINITYKYKGIFNVMGFLTGNDLVLRAGSMMRMECN